MLYAFLAVVWFCVGGALFFKTTPEGAPLFTLPLGNPPINGAWLAIALAIWNLVRWYQYISLRKSGKP